MPFEKGMEKQGGRRKGSKNKRSLLPMHRAEELGVDPFELLLYFAKGDAEKLGYKSISIDLRLIAIKEACQYIYSKKKAIEVNISETPLPERIFAFPDPRVIKDES